MKKLLKNIDYETVTDFANLVKYEPGQVISRTLVQNSHISITLFSFAQGEGIDTHSSSGDALVYILDGSAEITIGDKNYSLNAGQSIVMPTGKSHALNAIQPFKMLLTVVF